LSPKLIAVTVISKLDPAGELIVAGLVRCEQGHFYDSSRFSRCPYDGVRSIDFGEAEAPAADLGPKTPLVKTDVEGGDPDTVRVGLAGQPDELDPVVGWLVCIHGPERGRDYRIHSENNMLGRSADMDIFIEHDPLISRGRHTVITFDPQNNLFYLSPGVGQSLVYLNGKAVLAHQELKPYDEILVGATKLLFFPFCRDRFKWS
jgi:hypothetical protein